MSIKLHSPFIGTPICSSLDGRKNSKLVHFGRRWRHPERRSFLKCYKKSNWPPNGVWFPQIYGKIVKFLKGDIELRNGLRVNYVKERLSQGKELVKSLNPLWQEGLLLFRCSIFAAVISGVCLLLWYGRAKAKEYVELKLLPSVSSALSEYIERETNFGKVRRISPLSITLESCSFGPHSEEFSCGEAPTIKLRIHPFASLRRGKVVIDAVLSHPTLLVAQKKDFTWLGIPYIEEVGLEKHASTEDGIDNRTRIRRAAREEAGACWARERDDGARRAAETGYIVPNHGSDSTEIYAEASKNGSEESMNEQSHLCGDEGMHWKDHHSMDTGVPYDVKHDDLEKSFGYLARSELKPLSQTALGPTVPKFKKKANGKDLSVSDVTAKRRILEQSAAAASLYFRDIRHEKLAQSPSDTSLGNVNDVIRPATNRSEVIDVISEEDDDYGVSKATTHSTRNLRHDDDWPQLFSFPNQKLENTARSNLFHSSNPQVGDAKMTNDSFHRVGVTGKEDFNKSSRVSGGVDVISRDELVSDESDKKDIQGFESSMNTSTHQGNTESFDQALTNKEPSLEDNNSHSARTQSLRSNSSFFKGNIGEEVSHFVSDPIQKLKNGVDGTLGDVATNIVEVDDISSERIDKTLPVILDSVHFKGGTLMLLGYGDAEPRCTMFSN